MNHYPLWKNLLIIVPDYVPTYLMDVKGTYGMLMEKKNPQTISGCGFMGILWTFLD